MSLSLYARLHRRFGKRVDGITRREMLRATAAAGAGVLLSRVPAFAAESPKPNGKRVVIVGAGFAGLACAHELLHAGFEVSVIEARSRFGGRVLSLDNFVPGRNVEGGGELIGSNHPTWMAYAAQFDLEFLDVTEDDSLEYPIILGGQRLSNAEAESLYESMTAAFNSMNADAAEIDAEQPWRSANAKALDARSVGDWVDGLAAPQLCKTAIRVQLTADNAVPVARQSYLAHLAVVKGGGLEKYWTDSEVYRCKGGNQQLAMHLARNIGEQRISLGDAVSEVRVEDQKVKVTTARERQFEADHCVLAIPPTVWSKIKCTPALPEQLRLQMGTAVKYLSSIKERFWRDSGLGPDALTDGRVSMTWDGTDSQPGEGGAALVAFSGGPAAEQCLSIRREQIDDEYKRDLASIYAGFGEQFVAGRFMDWPRDPWAMCGYAFPAPGEVTTMGPVLHKGLGRLHFAGEHVCYKFVGFMEGALSSGASTARRIAEAG